MPVSEVVPADLFRFASCFVSLRADFRRPGIYRYVALGYTERTEGTQSYTEFFAGYWHEIFLETKIPRPHGNSRGTCYTT